MGTRLVVGIAGGSGSGKSTLVSGILGRLPGTSVALVEEDAYYRDLSHLSPADRLDFNYDHPDMIDSDLLIAHVQLLREGRAIEKPIYDFAANTRSPGTITVRPADVIIVEGILILVNPELRRLMDLRLFVDTDPDLRFIRRLRRDLSERGRTMESVIAQYQETVRPMHLEFVEPSKRFADVIIPEGGLNEVAIGMIAGRLEQLMGR